jgi:glutamine synthetase
MVDQLDNHWVELSVGLLAVHRVAGWVANLVVNSAKRLVEKTAAEKIFCWVAAMENL